MPVPFSASQTLSPDAIDALIERAEVSTPIKTDDLSIVWRVDLPDNETDVTSSGRWIVKRSQISCFRRVFPARLALTPGRRQLRGKALLAGSSLRFAGPTAVVMRQRRAFEYAFVPWVEGVTLDRWWPDAASEARPRMADALGRLLGELTAGGLRNRDFKPTNLLIDAPGEAGELPVMIDLDGVGRGGSRRDAVRSAAVLDRALRRIDTVHDVELRGFAEAFVRASPRTFGAEGPDAFLAAVAVAREARALSYDPEGG